VTLDILLTVSPIGHTGYAVDWLPRHDTLICCDLGFLNTVTPDVLPTVSPIGHAGYTVDWLPRHDTLIHCDLGFLTTVTTDVFPTVFPVGHTGYVMDCFAQARHLWSSLLLSRNPLCTGRLVTSGAHHIKLFIVSNYINVQGGRYAIQALCSISYILQISWDCSLNEVASMSEFSLAAALANSVPTSLQPRLPWAHPRLPCQQCCGLPLNLSPPT
jgi:hypothetical protein